MPTGSQGPQPFRQESQGGITLNWHGTWLLANGDAVDLCTENPGKDVDLYINSSVRTIVEVWEGDLDIRVALRNKSIKALGPRHLVRTMPDWFGVCLYNTTFKLNI